MISNKEITCLKCNGKNVNKDGLRETKNRGKVQRYRCSDCKFRFSIDEGFWKMKNHEDKITACMNMYYSGMSLRKIQQHLKMFMPHNSHYSTIYRWIIRYSEMIGKATDNFQVENGQELMSDEMEYHRLGKQNWFVDVIDTDTRFIVASDYMESRTLDDMTKVLKKGRKTVTKPVSIITTDGLKGYPRILRRSFGVDKNYGNFLNRKNQSKITHNIVIASERGFNHKIERLHGNIRDRTKIMRGFHGSLYSARMIMKGWEIYYNYVRKHQGIENKTPQEEAIPQLELGENKWLSLIRLSKS
jgi:putative transposase